MYNTQVSKKNATKGFTLVELLIVIVIIGLLSAIGLSSFISSQKKGRDARRKADLSAIQSALELYYNDFDAYPADFGAKIDGCDGSACDWNGLWQKNGTTYMVQIPSDPGGGSYAYDSDGSSYILYARLENIHDNDVSQCATGVGFYNTASFTCISGGCNYAVVSSNTTQNDLPAVVCE
ncbi:MAG: type II secretion system protein [Pseudomonadales bacterium]|nr:type II secretion system protein [Candidatus Woesebacteria bacterium]MCB9801455.1 type II secretion system protein [Pseudomonadales bacterium]